MKRLLLVFCAAILLSCFGPAPSVLAQDAQGATVQHSNHHWYSFHSDKVHQEKSKKTKHNKQERKNEKHEHLYNSPKSVGWWHKGPSPVGAGVK